MEKISSIAELREAIQILEIEQEGHLYLIREKFNVTLESLRPVNLVGNAVRDLVSTPNLKNKILSVAVGLFTGYLSNKVINIGASKSKFRKIIGNVVKVGVASIIVRNPNAVKSFREFIEQRIFRKRYKNHIKP
jgi:hypothetical protein